MLKIKVVYIIISHDIQPSMVRKLFSLRLCTYAKTHKHSPNIGRNANEEKIKTLYRVRVRTLTENMNTLVLQLGFFINSKFAQIFQIMRIMKTWTFPWMPTTLVVGTGNRIGARPRPQNGQWPRGSTNPRALVPGPPSASLCTGCVSNKLPCDQDVLWANKNK